MIIRKPYAFLIKNFKKIHILLLVLSLYVAYKIFDVTSFVSEFMRFGTYDNYSDPITKHITFGLQLAIIIICIGSIAILFLLRYKNKRWKLYLIPIIEYAILFFVLNMIKNFFSVYNPTIKTTDVRLSRDLLVMFAIAQIPAIITFIIRVFGLDKNKLDFNQDEEFLSLSEKDREEIEISLDVDKNSFKRLYRRILRNLNYFYIEHKIICIVIITLLITLAGYNTYKFFFITNRTYSEGEIYSANGYTMVIKNVYMTDKDYAGNVVSKKSNFIIAEVSVKNNSEPRQIEMENFHIRNATKDFVSTGSTYQKEFDDLGSTYDRVKELRRDEEASFIIVFKVDKKLDKNRYVMYYQEKSGYLRKIKIKIKDISEIEKAKDLKLGDTFTLKTGDIEDSVSFDNIEVDTETEYNIKKCTVDDCHIEETILKAPEGFKVLRIDFASEIYSSTKMVNFIKKHAKLEYIDNDKLDETIDIESLIDKKYYGKVLYLKIPSYLTEKNKMIMHLIIRNKAYNYSLN